MKASKSNPPCVLDVTFYSTREGRPEIYDFVWEYSPALLECLDEKTVELSVAPQAPYSEWSHLVGSTPVEVDYLVQKFLDEKRFAMKIDTNLGSKHSTLTARIPVQKMDALLNSHNILVDYFLPYLQFSTPTLRVDFASAHENRVRVTAPESEAALVRQFLKLNCQAVPLVHLFRFKSPSGGRA